MNTKLSPEYVVDLLPTESSWTSVPRTLAPIGAVARVATTLE